MKCSISPDNIKVLRKQVAKDLLKINEKKEGIKNETYHNKNRNAKKKPIKKTGFKVGVNGFEPSLSRPPDAHFNRTKLHPE